jgi:hypothetical protein
MTPADVTSKSPLLARTCGLRCFLSRALFEDKRPHSKQGWTGKDDPNPPSPLALAKLQNKASVLHRSFAQKMLRFLVVFDLPRAGDTLVVRRVDRLGRNYADMSDAVREFMRRGESSAPSSTI